ncbi:hypothetical protein ABT084_12370 [Streptomyces sp. NPDC002138]|uniref:hypothetical protein n=1 Tax=Streptomyces sp. NPDC002138 TaxID=3154410 RepID=UPI0033294E42
MITEHQRRVRERCLAAPVMPAPPPWRPVPDRGTPIGGPLGIGFAAPPDTGLTLAVATSSDLTLRARPPFPGQD